MKSVGIIAEYNPFHSGHKYHIEKAKRETDSECAVIALSPNFVQRGEPAVFDKWSRAETAVKNGADLVLELPTYFALQSAEGFALGGVSVLSSFGTDYISFGSEQGDIKPLSDIADILLKEPEEFKVTLASCLKEGLSFVSAREKALSAVNQSLSTLVKSPNNILGIEYLKQIRLNGLPLIPHTIKREGDYLSDRLGEKFASSSAIRSALLKGEDVSAYCNFPQKKPTTIYDFEQIILYSVTHDFIKSDDMGDGIFERIKKADTSSLDNLLESIKTRRHTMARIKRCLINILISNDLEKGLPLSYIRVLSANEKGIKLLSQKKESVALPLVTKPSLYNGKNDAIWNLECRATDIYYIKDGLGKGKNLSTSPIIVR